MTVTVKAPTHTGIPQGVLSMIKESNAHTCNVAFFVA